MLTRNKPNQQILDEAAEWFVDFREGDLNATAQQSFTQWLRRSPEHVTAYMEVAAFWADVPAVATKEDIDVAALVAYAQAEDNIVPLAAAGRASCRENAKPAESAVAQTSKTSRISSRIPFRSLAIAASIVVAVLAVALFATARVPTYATDIGEQRSVVLRDGSTVELNAKSRLRVRFTGEARRIELLEGQALFRVAKDPLRPFVVSSGDASVRAIGTQFDVYRKKSGTTVTVVEGKVAVSSAAARFNEPWGSSEVLTTKPSSRSVETPAQSDVGTVMLSAGEQIVVGMKMPSRPKPADIPTATAWTQRQVVFQGAPLGEVVDEFNRYNPRQMVVLDETLQSVRVSGVFSSTDPASLLRFLREQVRLEVTEGDESVRISRR